MFGQYILKFVLIVLLVGHSQTKAVSDETVEKSKVPFNYFNSSEDMGEEIQNRKRCDCYCGDQTALPAPYIREGEQARKHEFPWLATLYHLKHHQCGGALITLKHVATAAHCFYRIKLSHFSVGFGVHNHKYNDGMKQWRKISHAVYHKQYNPNSLVHDIGVLEMDAEVKLTYAVKPACLPVSDNDFLGWPATVAGWGLLHPGSKYPDELMKVEVKILSNAECKQTTFTHSVQVTNTMLCTGNPRSHKGTCRGDSGSPIHVTYPNGIREVIGAVSWGIGQCGSARAPSVLTRFSKYLKWIDERLGNTCRCLNRFYNNG